MITWLYPAVCPACLKPVLPRGAMLHPECRKKLEYIKEPVCMKCGVPIAVAEAEYCKACEGKDRGFDEGRSVFLYHGNAGRALKKVKKEGTKELISFFAKAIKINRGEFIRRMGVECIVPVPLHPSKLRQRGFNQAELLAEALGQELGLPVRLLIKKIKKTKDQKSLNQEQRRTNVKDAFALVDRELCGEQLPLSVLLLDDVSTTGSTLTACARVLKAGGVRTVAFISVCAGEQTD